MRKKQEIYVDQSNPCILVVNGAKFRMVQETVKVIDHKQHGGRVLFIPMDEERINKDIDFIVEHLEGHFNEDEIIREILKMTPLVELRKIKRLLLRGVPVRKTSGCLGLTIGDSKDAAYIQVV